MQRFKKVIFPICALSILSACSALDGLKADILGTKDAVRDVSSDDDLVPSGYAGQRRGAVIKPPGMEPAEAIEVAEAAPVSSSRKVLKPSGLADTQTAPLPLVAEKSVAQEQAGRKLIASTSGKPVMPVTQPVQMTENVVALDASWPKGADNEAPQVISNLEALPLASNAYRTPAVPVVTAQPTVKKTVSAKSVDHRGSVEAEMYMYADETHSLATQTVDIGNTKVAKTVVAKAAPPPVSVPAVQRVAAMPVVRSPLAVPQDFNLPTPATATAMSSLPLAMNSRVSRVEETQRAEMRPVQERVEQARIEHVATRRIEKELTPSAEFILPETTKADIAWAPAPMAEKPQLKFAMARDTAPVMQWNDIGNYDGSLPSAQAAAVTLTDDFSSDMAPVTSQRYQTETAPVYAGGYVAAPSPVAVNEAVSIFPLDDTGGDVQSFLMPGYTPVSYDDQPAQKKNLADTVANSNYGDAMQRIFFDHGSARIPTADKKQLGTLSKGLKRTETDLSVTVIGHASKRVDGTDDPIKRKMINFDMAQKRANAVTIEMGKSGVNPSWVQTVSKGDDEPNLNLAGRTQEAADRRVEIYVDGQ